MTPAAVPRVLPLARRFPPGGSGEGEKGCLSPPRLFNIPTYRSRLGCAPPPPRDTWGGGGLRAPLGVAHNPALLGALVASRGLVREIASGGVCARLASPARPRTPPRSRPWPAVRAAATPAALAPRSCGALCEPAGSSARHPAAHRCHRAGPGVAHTAPPAAAVPRGSRPLLPLAGRAALASTASAERAAGAAALVLSGGGNPIGTHPAAPLPAELGAASIARGTAPLADTFGTA